MDTGFILYPTYTVREGTAVAQYYGRLENGETFLCELPRTPFFYIREADLDQAKQTVSPLNTEECDMKTMGGEDVVKITVRIPKDVPPIRNQLQNAGVACFEADIRFSYRQLIDNNITAAVRIQGECERGERVDRVYHDPELVPAEDFDAELKIVSLDIETDRRADELWSISLTDGEREEALIVGREADGARTCADEKELLERLNDLIHDYDPDIITGWNLIDFDLAVLQDKYREHDVAFDWSRDPDREVRLRVESDFMRDSSADVAGRMVLDGIHLLRHNFVDMDSYSLEAAAQEYADQEKIFTGEDRYEQIKDSYDNDPQTFIDYNKLDAQLVLDILEESGTLALTIKRSLLTGMQLDRVKASIASLDMVYLPQLRKRGYVAPTSGYARKDRGITGGFVMDSEPGIYDNVLVLDFKSLYPSIMLTLNIDPLSYAPDAQCEESSQEYVRAENGACFAQEDGILPAILKQLWAERQSATKSGDELARYAIKILMNSFFGVLASPNCRFFSMDVANAITHTGQHLIKTTAQRLREQGYSVIYGDTDSIFVDVETKDSEQARTVGEQIEQDINAFFAEYVEQRYRHESYLELEFEKLFVRFLMPSTRSGNGSKKRYAGLLVEDGEQRMDVTGLELVRRDWTDLAKEFQKKLLELVFADEDPRAYIVDFVDQLKDGALDDLLVYRKALGKPLDQYKKTTPPHVKAARMMDGELTTNLIEYVQTVDGPEPADNVRHSIDYDHYIEKQLASIADQILVFYDTNFHDVLRGTQQKGLMDF